MVAAMTSPSAPSGTIPQRLSSTRPSISFEFMPPKDDAGEAVLWEAIARLEPFGPDFVSVTYGAGGSSQDRTLRVTEQIGQRTSLTAMAHLTCVSQSVDDLREVLAGYAAAGIDHVLALRGDSPVTGTQDRYSYLRLRDEVAARRDLPITPGLMPVTSVKQIRRMAQLMGTPLPAAVVDRLQAVDGDPAAVRAVGVEIATELADRMLGEGAPGLHLITMNRSTASLEVLQNLSHLRA